MYSIRQGHSVLSPNKGSTIVRILAYCESYLTNEVCLMNPSLIRIVTVYTSFHSHFFVYMTTRGHQSLMNHTRQVLEGYHLLLGCWFEIVLFEKVCGEGVAFGSIMEEEEYQ